MRNDDEIAITSAVTDGKRFVPIGHALQMEGGIYWKPIKSEFYANGYGESEQHLIMIRTIHTCDYTLLSILNESKPINSKTMVLNDTVKFGDVFLNVDKTDDPDYKHHMQHGVNEVNVHPSDSSTQDQGSWDFKENIKLKGITHLTPYAGDGVGVIFPTTKKSHGLVFTPNGNHNDSFTGLFTWKEGKNEEVVPSCNDADFLLRLQNGYLYFDAEKKTWLLRSSEVKIEAEDPEDASNRPEVGDGDTTFIKLGASGTIIINGSTILLGNGASKFVALADHVHKQTWFTPVQVGILQGLGVVGPFDTTTTSVGESSSNSTKAKAD
jgi:hypothetical protein